MKNFTAAAIFAVGFRCIALAAQSIIQTSEAQRAESRDSPVTIVGSPARRRGPVHRARCHRATSGATSTARFVANARVASTGAASSTASSSGVTARGSGQTTMTSARRRRRSHPRGPSRRSDRHDGAGRPRRPRRWCDDGRRDDGNRNRDRHRRIDDRRRRSDGDRHGNCDGDRRDNRGPRDVAAFHGDLGPHDFVGLRRGALERQTAPDLKGLAYVRIHARSV